MGEYAWIICKYYAVFYKGVELPWVFGILGGFWNQSPPRILRDNCIAFSIVMKVYIENFLCL